jgi:hypothetical protein
MTKKSVKGGIDLRRVLKKEMENKWVALSVDYKKVFDFSDDLASLTKKIGTEKVVYMKVLPSDISFAFSDK